VEKTWKPTVAGILDIISGVSGVIVVFGLMFSSFFMLIMLALVFSAYFLILIPVGTTLIFCFGTPAFRAY